jgi:hypothetical protein
MLEVTGQWGGGGVPLAMRKEQHGLHVVADRDHEIGGSGMARTDSRPSIRTGVGRVELVPEPTQARVRSRVRTNLAGCRYLLIAAVVAQAADVVTTQLGIGAGYVEQNALLRPLVGSGPLGTLAVKVAAVLAVMAVALFRLPLLRARVAVGLALALSLIGPFLNIVTLLGR